jgi:hypothetical protein
MTADDGRALFGRVGELLFASSFEARFRRA